MISLARRKVAICASIERRARTNACPARAISFGDMNDAKSEVTEWKRRPLEYPLLGELNTVPRTTYLAELLNGFP